MRWRRLLTSAFLGGSLTTGGCAQQASLVAADPDIVQAIAAAGGADTGGVTRAQKPEGDAKQPITLLSMTPENIEGAGQRAAQIWATVNGEAILADEVLNTIRPQLAYIRNLPEPERSQKANEVRQGALQTIIEREVVLQDAITKLTARGGAKFLDKLREAAGKDFEKTWLKGMKQNNKIASDEELTRFLKANGITLEAARRQYERQFMAMEYLRSRVLPIIDRETGHEQIADYYEKHQEEFQVADMVQWQDLFIAAARHPNREAARRFAESVAQRLRQGEDFKALSKQFDDGDSRLRDGDGIGRKHGEIKPAEAEPILFNMKDGEVGPILEIATGYHVIRLVKRTQAGLVPFDEKVQKQIKDKIRGEVASREMKRIVNDLKRQAVIEYAR